MNHCTFCHIIRLEAFFGGSETQIDIFVSVAEFGVEPVKDVEQVTVDGEACAGDGWHWAAVSIPSTVVGGEDPVGNIEIDARMLDFAVRVDESTAGDTDVRVGERGGEQLEPVILIDFGVVVEENEGVAGCLGGTNVAIFGECAAFDDNKLVVGMHGAGHTVNASFEKVGTGVDGGDDDATGHEGGIVRAADRKWRVLRSVLPIWQQFVGR